MVDEKKETKENILDLSKLSNLELMEFYEKIKEHLSYLNNNILSTEEEK